MVVAFVAWVISGHLSGIVPDIVRLYYVFCLSYLFIVIQNWL